MKTANTTTTGTTTIAGEQPKYDANLSPFITLTGSIGAAEVLQHAYLCSPTGVYQPKSSKALHHLIKLGYLSPDYGKGLIMVCHDKIQTDLMAISTEPLQEAA